MDKQKKKASVRMKTVVFEILLLLLDKLEPELELELEAAGVGVRGSWKRL